MTPAPPPASASVPCYSPPTLKPTATTSNFPDAAPSDYPFGGGDPAAFPSPGGSSGVGGGPAVEEVAHHWFYQVRQSGGESAPSAGTAAAAQGIPPPPAGAGGDPSGTGAATVKEVWRPFSMIDSVAIEDVFLMDPNGILKNKLPNLSRIKNVSPPAAKEPIPVEGGRFDVCLPDRTKSAVYWREDRPSSIRRCSWFFRSHAPDGGRWTPYHEATGARLEAEYASAVRTGTW